MRDQEPGWPDLNEQIAGPEGLVRPNVACFDAGKDPRRRLRGGSLGCLMRPQSPVSAFPHMINGVLEAGKQAPDFKLKDQNGETVTLSDYSGKAVVLYFYPKANTPGCATQACGIRDRMDEYRNAGATVIGISPDEVKAVRKFDDAHGFGFTLLADKDHKVAE